MPTDVASMNYYEQWNLRMTDKSCTYLINTYGSDVIYSYYQKEADI